MDREEQIIALFRRAYASAKDGRPAAWHEAAAKTLIVAIVLLSVAFSILLLNERTFEGNARWLQDRAIRKEILRGYVAADPPGTVVCYDEHGMRLPPPCPLPQFEPNHTITRRQ